MKTSPKLLASTGKIFVTGVLFVLPIFLTIAILLWVLRAAESLLIEPIKHILPQAINFPGLGVLLAMVTIYLIGLAIHGRVLSFLFRWMELLLDKIPIFNVVYRNIREMIDFVSGGKDDELDRVVLVSFDTDIKLIGFVTNPRCNLPIEDKPEATLTAVYMPMSYQMGGYVVYVPESRLETLSMSSKDAMQRVLTAEISTRKAKAVNTG